MAKISLTTESLEAMMMTSAIDSKEVIYVALTDIQGAFLQTDMDEDVHMILEGKIAKLIMKLEPKLYRKYVWKNNNGMPVTGGQR